MFNQITVDDLMKKDIAYKTFLIIKKRKHCTVTQRKHIYRSLRRATFVLSDYAFLYNINAKKTK